MVCIKIPANSPAEDKILSYYTTLYSDYIEECRLLGKNPSYSREKLIRNIQKALDVDGAEIHERLIRPHPLYDPWREKGRLEFSFYSWHFAIELKNDDGKVIGIVRDAVNNTDYHKDIMENSPYDTHNETRANSILKYVKTIFLRPLRSGRRH